MSNAPEHDPVHNVKHYEIFKGIEAKEIIELVLTSDLAAHLDNYEAYCLGNLLKYRLRAGNKDKLEQDIAKAERYKELLK